MENTNYKQINYTNINSNPLVYRNNNIYYNKNENSNKNHNWNEHIRNLNQKINALEITKKYNEKIITELNNSYNIAYKNIISLKNIIIDQEQTIKKTNDTLFSIGTKNEQIVCDYKYTKLEKESNNKIYYLEEKNSLMNLENKKLSIENNNFKILNYYLIIFIIWCILFIILCLIIIFFR